MTDALPTRPNVFQRLMLQWERLAPYNAGQYMTLAGDPPNVTEAWHAVVESLGLQHIGQQEADNVAIPAYDERQTPDVDRWVSGELNRPFAVNAAPLRPFVLADNGVTHIGLIYRHVVADSASIRFVMRAWFDRLHGLALPPPIRVSGDLGGETSYVDLARAAVREISRASRVKRVRRLPADRADPASAVAWRRIELEPGVIDRALGFARRKGAKLNDVFLAAAALACDAHVPFETSRDRRDLGVGTIVDVRPSDRPPGTHFGLSLGFLQTFWRPQDLGSFDVALGVSARTSRLARERSEAGGSLLRLAIAEHLGRRMCDRDLAAFYRKRCPLAAGISNVNLNRDWPARHHPLPLVSYTRVSPLGPMLPLVFTPTTIGTTANLGVSYRTSMLDEPRANRVIDAFVRQLTRLK